MIVKTKDGTIEISAASGLPKTVIQNDRLNELLPFYHEWALNEIVRLRGLLESNGIKDIVDLSKFERIPIGEELP